jgi:hypothetical protein
MQCVVWAHAEGVLLRRIFSADRACFSAQAALLIGIAYQFAPIDLIPNRIPVVGHADEFAFLLSGFLLARRLAPPLRRACNRVRAIVPTFFIVGAARCGTTSLFDALGEHPDVFCCPVKEPNHFATELRERPWVIESARRRGVLIEPGSAALTVRPRVAITPDYDMYLRLFEDWEGQSAVGEASTAYLMSPRSGSRRRASSWCCASRWSGHARKSRCTPNSAARWATTRTGCQRRYARASTRRRYAATRRCSAPSKSCFCCSRT